MPILILKKIGNDHNTYIQLWIKKAKVPILLCEIFFKWHLNGAYVNIVVGLSRFKLCDGFNVMKR